MQPVGAGTVVGVVWPLPSLILTVGGRTAVAEAEIAVVASGRVTAVL